MKMRKDAEDRGDHPVPLSDPVIRILKATGRPITFSRMGTVGDFMSPRCDDSAGAWVRNRYRFFTAADAESFARHRANHQWASVKRVQVVPTQDLPTDQWNADTCEVVKLMPAEIAATLDAMGK
jgi:hypothetical protein